MLIDEGLQQNLISALHLEPLFNSVHLDSYGRRVTNRDPVMHQSSAPEVDQAHQLLALLQSLSIGADVAAASVKRNNVATARAVASIAEWMRYLPEDCVKAMVSGGWHWST